MVPLRGLLETFESATRNHATMLVGIDGRGGSGKSTLARALAALSPTVTVVPIDDFYIPHGLRTPEPEQLESATDDTDEKRFRQQLVDPLSHDHPARYQRGDWPSEALAEWREIPAGGIVLIEGVATCRREWRELWDFRIWVDCPREQRLERGLARDGEAMRETWERWLPAGDRYEEEHRPRRSADLVVDGSSHASHDPTRAFISL